MTTTITTITWSYIHPGHQKAAQYTHTSVIAAHYNHTFVRVLEGNIANKSLVRKLTLRGNVKKKVYLKTLSKLRLTSLPPTLYLTNLFLTQC